MSIRVRLTLLYTFILALILTLFGVAVYLISRETLLAEFDENLLSVASNVRDETQAVVLRDVAVVTVPDNLDVFESASFFMTLLDADGDVIGASPNLADFGRMLDPTGLRQELHYSMVVQHGQPLRVLSLPLAITSPTGREEIIGYLQVATSLDSYYLALNRLGLTLVFTGFAAVTLSLFAGVLLTHSLLKPLDDIGEAALQITRADDLGRRLPDSGRQDEIGNLTVALNTTLERLETLFRSQQRFLADVSHELRTPLTALRGNVDLMKRMGAADPESLDAMREELERMSRLVNDLLFLARTDSGGLPIQRQPVELDTIFLDVCRLARRLSDTVRIEVAAVDQVRLLGDADRLRQLLLNLVDNAVKYTPPGGKVALSLSQENGHARVRIADSGIGIPDTDLPHIFDRFYRVDKARTRGQGGSGLGLSIAQWIVQAHGGEITVNSAVNQGTVFEVILPVLPEMTRMAPEPARELHPALRFLGNSLRREAERESGPPAP